MPIDPNYAIATIKARSHYGTSKVQISLQTDWNFTAFIMHFFCRLLLNVFLGVGN